MTKPLLQIRGIRKQYGPVVAVQDVNLDVQPGEQGNHAVSILKNLFALV